MNKDEGEIKKNLKKNLSDFLGIEPEDIEDDFSLTEDLHMKASDLTDFIETLSKMGMDTDKIDFQEIETFSDLADYFVLQQ